MDSDRLRKRAELLFWERSQALLKDGPPASPAEMKALYAQCWKDAQRELALDEMLGTLETAAAGLVTLEYKTLPEPLTQQFGSDATATVVGYGACFDNLDLGNDIIHQGAFKQTITEAKQFAAAHRSRALWPVLWMHNKDEVIGCVTSAFEDRKGLRCTYEFDRDIERGRQAFNGLRRGYLSFSIGYRPTKYEWQGRIRHLREITLAEISAVSWPMNPEARAIPD